MSISGLLDKNRGKNNMAIYIRFASFVGKHKKTRFFNLSIQMQWECPREQIYKSKRSASRTYMCILPPLQFEHIKKRNNENP